MAVNLSPVGGVAAQFFTNTGAVLTGGKLYTYAAGTTTPAVTYTSSNGLIAWTNPIVLDAAGRVPGSGEIWLTDGINYKFVLKDANDVLIATYDNISYGDAFQISYVPPFTGSEATNVGDKLAQTVSVKDFGAVGDGIADDTLAFQTMLDYMSANKKAAFIPQGIYKITDTLTYTNQEYPLAMYGEVTFDESSTAPRIEFVGTFTDGFLVKGEQGSQGCDIRYLKFKKKSGSTVANGLQIQNLRNPRIYNCSFSGFSTNGILFSDESGSADSLVISAAVKNCYFTSTNNGISFTQTESGQSNNHTIDTCSFYGLDSGVRFEGLYSNNIRVLNSVFEAISGDDIYFKQAVTVLIQGNYFESNGFVSKAAFINFWQGESGVYFDAINLVNNNFQGAVQYGIVVASSMLGMDASSNHYAGIGNKPFLRITNLYNNLSIERPTKYQGDSESLTYTVETADGEIQVNDRVFNYRRASRGEANAVVSFDGTSSVGVDCDLKYAFNVNSVTHNNTGDYIVNFQWALEAAEFATTFGTKAPIGSACVAMIHASYVPNTSNVRVSVYNLSGTPIDCPQVNVVVHGNF